MNSLATRRELGRRLQQQRLANRGRRSLSLVARLMGVSQPTLWRWEHGQGVPDALQLVRFAEVCGTSAKVLVEGLGRSAPHQLVLGLPPSTAAVVLQLVDLLKARERPARRRARRSA
jgi:transcriptional regulator with XRE-family HTH domain